MSKKTLGRRTNLQRVVHPHLLTASADGPLAEPITVLQALRDGYPDGRISGIDAPTTARPTYLAYVTSGDQFRTVLVDPLSGDILGELPEHSVVRTLQDLHFDLLAGPTGRIVNGIGSVCLLLLCLTGLVVWWPAGPGGGAASRSTGHVPGSVSPGTYTAPLVSGWSYWWPCGQ